MLSDRFGFVCQCTARKDGIAVSPRHVVNAFFNGQRSEVKGKGTAVLGGQTDAEVAALELVADWTKKVTAELAIRETKLQSALVMQAILQ